jgi:hypothetical protein
MRKGLFDEKPVPDPVKVPEPESKPEKPKIRKSKDLEPWAYIKPARVDNKE